MKNSMPPDKTPVIVGIAQHTQDKETTNPLDPLGLMTLTGKQALADTGKENLTQHCDTIRVVNIMSHTYRDVCADLAQSLKIIPSRTFYSTMSGNSPQLYLNQTANDIAMGRSRMTLIAGAEAHCAIHRARKGQVALDWPEIAPPEQMDGDDRPGATDMEFGYDLIVPACAYALFENALRYALGRNLDTHQQAMGHICEHLTNIAARNPYSWIKQTGTAEEITTPGPNNRWVAFPYTLRMVANVMVDQAAAVVMTSVSLARELGIPEEKWVYPQGGATLNNIWHVSQRPTLHDSPALNQAARLALKQAGITIDNIDLFDFYSCFPCAVEIARRELGVSSDDSRDLSIAGGLAYFGGPGSNYPLHAIVGAVEKIRTRAVNTALITALGWYNTKWSVGVYGAQPGAAHWKDRDDSDIQAEIDSHSLAEPVVQAEGIMTIETYTILYDRTSLPLHITVLGRLEDGSRAFAFISANTKKMVQLARAELIEKSGPVHYDNQNGYNILHLQ